MARDKKPHEQLPDKEITVVGVDKSGTAFTETFTVKSANPKRIAKAIATGWQKRRGYPIAQCKSVNVMPARNVKAPAPQPKFTANDFK
jgi:hypothetical protein